ncbi:ABC transporter permease [Catenovulum adriaticum]|uniref:ABC transporter permease n=1 Tax=Catenovulum adriaticum TaxID=2984846 RepID=A0ABY7ARX2_9ALTE|nr:ABC transporter permease [Catenovulum sp. TS8]WAJ72008.1 ABC transporter permease [Catenovulum sp. TS8]
MVFENLAKQKWLPIALATFLMSIVLSFVSPVFLTLTNFESVLVQASVTAIMSIGMTFIIILAGIDISVGAILFFVSSLFAQTLNQTGSVWLAFSAALLSGCVLGLVNGLLIVRFKVTPLITTLATYTIYRGLALHLTGAQNIPVPREMGWMGNGNVFGIPVPIIFMLLFLLVGIYLLMHTRFGLYCKAIGSSAQSATESGLPINKVNLLAYCLGGICAATAALILIARVGGLQSGIGIGLEFTVIAAVILGGTKLSGGSGSVAGSVIGAIFLVLIDNGLNLFNASPYIYDIVRGVVLIIAVFVDRVSVLKSQPNALKFNASTEGNSK